MAQKSDLKRLGIFQEMSYHTIGDPYVSPSNALNMYSTKTRGLAPMYLAGGYSKTKAANSDGYFAPFESVRIGDGGATYADILRQKRKEGLAKIVGARDWIPASGHKSRCGTGGVSGNFQEIYPALNPAQTSEPKRPSMKNFCTNPGKKGTGYGYPDVCLNRFPSWRAGDTTFEVGRRMRAEAAADHVAKLKGRQPFVSASRPLDAFDINPWAQGDPLAPGCPSEMKFGIANFPKSMIIGPTFIPSNPAKRDGGMKSGTINRFPDYTNDTYMDPYRLRREGRGKLLAGQWIPNPNTALVIPQPSIINKNIALHMNPQTYKGVQSVWNACS